MRTHLVLFACLFVSPIFAASEMKNNVPLLIDFARAKMVRRVETQNTFYFEECAIPADIARQVVDDTFENLRALKDKLPCRAINDVRLNSTHPRDQLVLEEELGKALQVTIMEAFHKSADDVAVITGFGQVLAVSSFTLAIWPFAKYPPLKTLTYIAGGLFQLGTLYLASTTTGLWIRMPPKILESSARKALSVNPNFYAVPPAAGKLHGSVLFDAFLKALDTATRKTSTSKQ